MARLGPVAEVAGGVAVTVRLTPKASRERVGPVETDAAGRAVLRVAVTEPPEGGKANRALVRLLAKAWRIPKSALTITRGARARLKTLVIDERRVVGGAAGLSKKLGAALGDGA